MTLYGKIKNKKFSYERRCIFINRMYQFCSDWYYEYHFFSYIVPTLFFPAHKKLKVLVIGGGDLIGSSMLLKYADIDYIDLVDIDKNIIKMARKDFKNFFFEKKPYLDKRLKIHIGDAFVYVNRLIKEKKKYDIIVYDLPVVNNYKLLPLMSIEFFKKLRALMNKNSVLSIYQEIGGYTMYPIKKESLLIACAGFKKLLFMRGFKIKPSKYISYEDSFFYFTDNNNLKIKNEKLLRKLLLNRISLINRFFYSGTLYNLKCNKNIKLNSIFSPDFSILRMNEKLY